MLAEIEGYARRCCAEHDPAHDALHVARVVGNAKAIVAKEVPANGFVVESAAWLHDIVQMPKGSGPPGEAARQSASQAHSFLDQLRIDPRETDAIVHAIEAHSFSGGLRPETIEAAIVQDADRLDALGAIGLARLWVVAGTMGSDLHHEADPAAIHRPLDDRAYGLDHIPAKLLKLPDLMNTQTGRAMATERAAFVTEFYATFLREIGV